FEQIAAVIRRDHVHAIRQRSFDFFQLLFYTVDDIERVLAVTHHDDAANDFATPIEFRYTAPDITAEMDVCDIFQINRRAVLDFENNVLDVLDLLDVAAAANVILGRRDFEDLAAYVGIAHLDRADDVAERDVVSNERVWIEVDLILLNEAADRCDLGDAFY